jgi:hypothetical protein
MRCEKWRNVVDHEKVVPGKKIEYWGLLDLAG